MNEKLWIWLYWKSEWICFTFKLKDSTYHRLPCNNYQKYTSITNTYSVDDYNIQLRGSFTQKFYIGNGVIICNEKAEYCMSTTFYDLETITNLHDLLKIR